MSCRIVDSLELLGGQVAAMYPEKDIFDVAGFPAVKGRVLVEALVEQAAPFNPTYVLDHQAMTLETSEEGPVTVTTTGDVSVEAKAVVINGGIGSFTPRALPAGDGWAGRGLVYFVPRLDEHAGKDIVIVGGGDSAFDWAYMLQPVAKSVSLVHRRDAFRAHASMVDQVRAMGVTLYTSCEVVELRGDGSLQEMEIKSKTTGESIVLPAQTAVAALGFIANIGPMADWGLELDHRRIVVGSTMQSNLPRVFGAGDIVTYPGKVPLISVGFGEAALAVNNAAPIIDPDSHIFPGHSSGGSAD